jgi:hypothetical protein
MLTLSICLIAELLFIIGAGPPLTVFKYRSTVIAQTQPPTTEIEFEGVSAGSGRKREGTPFSFALYKSTDRIGVSASTEKYRSPNAAANAFRKKMGHAAKVVEIGTKFNPEGKRTGARSVAIFPPQGTSKAQAMVLWTDGSDFHYIQSTSLRHALAFEKSSTLDLRCLENKLTRDSHSS